MDKYFVETYPILPLYTTGIQLQSQSSAIVIGVPLGMTVSTFDNESALKRIFRFVVVYFVISCAFKVNAKMIELENYEFIHVYLFH